LKPIEQPHELIENYDVLTSTYVPDRLLHRDDKIKEIQRYLSRAIGGSTPPHLLLTGPSGSGKTVTIRRVLKSISKRARHAKIAYVEATGGAPDSLYQLATECGIGLERHGLSFEGNIRRFKDSLKDSLAIFVLDELDMMLRKGGEMLLYHLSRRERTCIVGVSRRIWVLDLIKDAGIRSSFNPRKIFFPPYNAIQLGDILRDRRKLAGARVDDGAINLCASLALGKGERRGDARYALDLLQFAIDVAERAEADQVTETHVKIAEKEVEREYVIRAMISLQPPEKRLLLFTVGPEPRPATSVYRLANDRARDLGYPYRILSHKRLADFLSGLERDGFVDIDLKSRGRGKGKGWTVKLSEWLDSNTIKSVMESTLGRK